ncbi:SNAP25 homologous protein SNAP33 [Linum perenne]
MFGSTKSPLRVSNQNKVSPKYKAPSHGNPFDSDDELDTKEAFKPSKKSLEPELGAPSCGTNPFDDHEGKRTSSPSLYPAASSARNKYKNDFRDSGGLEDYAVYKAEETTKAVNGCLKIAEDIREDATKTLITLHQTWKPKKTRSVTGPVITRDDSHRRGNHLQQREKLGLNTASKAGSNSRALPTEPTNAYQKVEIEKAKQDDAFSDLSDLLGELKDMAVDMGTEIDKQTKALDHYQDDVDVLDFRIKGANQRTRRLLGK